MNIRFWTHTIEILPHPESQHLWIICCMCISLFIHARACVCAIQSSEDIIKTAVSFKRFHHLQSRWGSTLCINHSCQLYISPFPLNSGQQSSYSPRIHSLLPGIYCRGVFQLWEFVLVRENIFIRPIMGTSTMHQISCRTVFALVHHAVCILLTLLCLHVSQVKQIMEEAVTRKFVHEDSGHIVSFCGKSLNIQMFSWTVLVERFDICF